jgi:23S rRNA-intervening sequence protein
MRVSDLSRAFPVEEKFALTSQIGRSSPSVCLKLREAWAKRRYEAHFVGKLTDCERPNSCSRAMRPKERTAKRSHPWILRGTWLHGSRTGIGHHLKGGRQDDWRHDHQPAPVPDLRPPLRSFSPSLATLPYTAVTLWLAALLRVRALG